MPSSVAMVGPYRATGFGYGLWGHQPFQVDELPIRLADQLAPVEIVITPVDVADGALTVGAGTSVVVKEDRVRGRYEIAAPGYGRVTVVPDASQIVVETNPAFGRWQDLVVAQALPLLALLHGSEAMHASAVVIDGQAVLITAPSGSGKTTLAAYLAAKGFALLTDDVVILRRNGNDGVLAYPSGCHVHVGQRDADVLERQSLARASEREGKVALRVPAVSHPVRVGAVVFLTRRQEPAPLTLSPVGQVPPQQLLGATFNAFLQTPSRLLEQLDIYQSLATTSAALTMEFGSQVGPVEAAEALSEWVLSCS